MKEYYEILNWDTNFFGFKVAKIKNDFFHNERVNILESLFEKNIKLSYYSSSYPIPDHYYNNGLYDINLIIRRIPIIKKLHSITAIHDKISSYDKDHLDTDLSNLAQLAGSQGRFGNDPKISKEKCDELFKIWMSNCVKKVMADEVLVYKEGNKILGFVTIKLEKDIAYAPLFAVYREFEGKGISFALMRAAETVAAKGGAEVLMSGTQERNLKALKVYERFGFRFGKPEYVYHLWKKES